MTTFIRECAKPVDGGLLKGSNASGGAQIRVLHGGDGDFASGCSGDVHLR